jgi:hypothetical protein
VPTTCESPSLLRPFSSSERPTNCELGWRLVNRLASCSPRDFDRSSCSDIGQVGPASDESCPCHRPTLFCWAGPSAPLPQTRSRLSPDGDQVVQNCSGRGFDVPSPRLSPCVTFITTSLVFTHLARAWAWHETRVLKLEQLYKTTSRPPEEEDHRQAQDPLYSSRSSSEHSES